MGLTFAASSTDAKAPNIELPAIYDARFDAVREDSIEASKFDPECFIWGFTLFEDGEAIYDEGEPVTVEGVTSRSVNTKSKTTPRAVRYLKALMTADEFEGFLNEEPVKADDLIGRFVQVSLIKKESGWPKVEDVLPARRSRKARS